MLIHSGRRRSYSDFRSDFRTACRGESRSWLAWKRIQTPKSFCVMVSAVHRICGRMRPGRAMDQVRVLACSWVWGRGMAAWSAGPGASTSKADGLKFQPVALDAPARAGLQRHASPSKTAEG